MTSSKKPETVYERLDRIAKGKKMNKARRVGGAAYSPKGKAAAKKGPRKNARMKAAAKRRGKR